MTATATEHSNCEHGIEVATGLRSVTLVLFALLLSIGSPAVNASDLQNPVPAKTLAPLPATPPRSLITDVATNEIHAIQHQDSYLRYRIRTVDRKGDRTRDMIESRDGTVARLIFKDGKPLSEDEEKAERDRLNDMIASPSEFAKHIHNDQTGKKLAIDLIQLMPDAMTYSYTPGQPQIAASKSGRQIVLDYTPDPRWSPPNITAEALTGLRGRMWIDAATHQLLRMEGDVFQGVNFGWGMLAHIYPGGKLTLEQTNVGSDRWIFTRFIEHVKVRALMVKTLNENTTIEASAFQVLPRALTYQEAIQQLLAAPRPTL